MGFSIRTLSEYDRFFVVDIGSSRVKVLLCELANGELKIIGKASTRQSKKYTINGEIADLRGVSESVHKTVLKLSQMHEGIVEDVIFSIQSGSMITDTLSMNYVRENPNAPLDMEEIDRMIGKIESKSLDRAKPRILARVLESEGQMKLVTTALTSIVIDGKKVSNPIGFSGTNISLTVCNVFLPVSTFLLYSSIVRDLDKKLISFVPTAIALPKAQEASLELFDPNCFVDIGASHTTVVLENYSEILGSVIIPFGASMLESIFARKHPTLSHLEVENRLVAENTDDAEVRSALDEFLDILVDSITVALRDIAPDFLVRNIYFSGAISTAYFIDLFMKAFKSKLPHMNLRGLPLIPESEKLAPEFAVSYALTKTAEELVRQKHDPIARILRYVIYRYE